MLADISPRRALDDDYRGFLDLIAGHLARAIANTRLLEETKAAKAELELKATELQQNAIELEMQSEELIAATDELEEANRRLSVSETRLRQANTAAGIGTWELDVDNGEFICDDQCRSVLGLHRKVLTYDALSGAVHEEDRGAVASDPGAGAAAARSTDEATFLDFDAEFRVLIPGAPKWAALTGRTFFEAGETAGRSGSHGRHCPRRHRATPRRGGAA